VKKIFLTPYPGQVILAKNVAEFKKIYKQYTGEETRVPKTTVGRCQPLEHDKYATTYLVFAESASDLAHELSHVVLKLFQCINTDPRGEGEEPFCYLLAHLLDEATKK
jgi:hypothetical protein